MYDDVVMWTVKNGLYDDQGKTQIIAKGLY